MEALTILQKRWGGAVLLKGTTTLMTDGVHCAANQVGSPALAKGGSGDVLAGVLVALLAQRERLGLDALTVMQLGTYLHGRAGQRAEERFGATGATAWEVVQSLAGIWEEKMM